MTPHPSAVEFHKRRKTAPVPPRDRGDGPQVSIAVAGVGELFRANRRALAADRAMKDCNGERNGNNDLRNSAGKRAV